MLISSAEIDSEKGGFILHIIIVDKIAWELEKLLHSFLKQKLDEFCAELNDPARLTLSWCWSQYSNNDHNLLFDLQGGKKIILLIVRAVNSFIINFRLQI